MISYSEEDSVDVVFHGVSYNLSLTTYSESGGEVILGMDLEELGSGATWHGEFPATYIESVTGKTGSFKRFDVFVKMFQGALWRQADTVFLDLLTHADLEVLRARKQGGAAAAAAPAPISQSNSEKRYLILTYVAEFDR